MSLVQLYCSIYGKFTLQYTAFIIEHIQDPGEKVILGGVSSPIIYLPRKSEKSLIFLLFYSSWTPFAHPCCGVSEQCDWPEDEERGFEVTLLV